MTDKLTPEQVAEITARHRAGDYITDAQIETDIAALLASHASLVAELKARDDGMETAIRILERDAQTIKGLGHAAKKHGDREGALIHFHGAAAIEAEIAVLEVLKTEITPGGGE